MLDAPDTALKCSSDGLGGVGMGAYIGPGIGSLLNKSFCFFD